ncbi:MAG: class I SAM-dependent methyltransferase [Acidobacteriota bacterium]|nr:class I SAM-dependent methyltransferase [Acidobacteriota bacterium]
MAADSEKIAELSAIIQTVRDRVRARYPRPRDGVTTEPGIQISLPDLLPVVHARDAAQAKIAAIGSVNPRAGGLVNSIVQLVKKAVARSLQWFVRDQITFNRETITAIEALMEALNEQNRILLSLAAQTNEQIGYARAAASELGTQLAASIRPLTDQITELKDIRRHWIEWRPDWERKLALNEIQFLRNVADLQGATQHRSTLMESNFRDIVKAQHNDYLGAIDRATTDIQKRLWNDLEKARGEFERLIHSELRLIRQRGFQQNAAPPVPPPLSPPAATAFDYARFAERFRGSEDYVRGNQEFYKPFFAACTNVLDIGCGRGEFLEAMREAGVAARGIDLSEESAAQCRSKGLEAEKADLFDFLERRPDADFDGIFSSQVAEHIEPERLGEMIRVCASKLRRGGLLAIETPNPECLAIFATHFYLDPTHTKPVPSALLSFYMEEAGLGMIEIHPLSPAVDSIPEIAELPEGFRKRFFGGLDYAIIGRKL